MERSKRPVERAARATLREAAIWEILHCRRAAASALPISLAEIQRTWSDYESAA
jgi:hypothetical protein